MQSLRDKIKNSDVFSYLSSLGYMPRWVVLICDTVLVVVAYHMSFDVLHGFYYGPRGMNVGFSMLTFGITMILQLFWFWVFHTYSGILRYSSFVDAIKIFFAVSCTTLTLILMHYCVSYFDVRGVVLPRMTLVTYFLFSFFLLLLLRLFVKTIYDTFVISSGRIIPVVVYGIKAAGVSIGQMLYSAPNSRYKLVGFVEDGKVRPKQRIFGLPVVSLDEKDRFVHRMKRYNVRAVVVSPSKLRTIDRMHGLDPFINQNIDVMVVPEMRYWKEGDDLSNINIYNLKSISIDELLNREPIVLDNDNVLNFVRGKEVLITGAAGSIGSEIVRQVAKLEPLHVVLIDNAESPMHAIKLEIQKALPNSNFSFVIADVRNLENMEQIFTQFRPNIVFHAAAYKHVPLMEDFPSQAIVTNVYGTQVVADLAVKFKVEKFVMVSTDKAVNPTNVMGASKRIAEIYVQSYFNKQKTMGGSVTQFITTRFGNVLGSNGSVIPFFKQQIEEGGPVTVTHPDIVRYFMTIPEACQLVLQAAALGCGGEIFVFDMGQAVKIYDLAVKMIRLAGYVPNRDIQIIFTGLRSGEKLYEELLNDKEIVEKTDNEKIKKARVREYSYDELLPQIEQLVRYAYLGKDFLVVKTMKEILPEYISNNSVYEEIDFELRAKTIRAAARPH